MDWPYFWSPLKNYQMAIEIFFNHSMAIDFQGDLKVYEFLNAILGFIFEHFFSHLGFVFLVAHLQPLHGTLGELKWSSPWF
jgi:hypothetical protein